MGRPSLGRNGETKLEVLGHLVDWWDGASYGPTVEQLRCLLGLSTRSTVQWHINSLLEDGFAERIPKKHKTLRPTDKGRQLIILLKENDGT